MIWIRILALFFLDRINRIFRIILCFHHFPDESDEVSWLSSGKPRSKYPKIL